jgi:hypothetical protein
MREAAMRGGGLLVLILGLTAAAMAVWVLVVPALMMTAAARYRPTVQWRQRVAEWARKHGWRAEVRPRVEWTERLPGKNHWGVTMLVSGETGGREVAVGNYSYTTITDHSTRTHFLVVSTVRVPTPTPSVAVYRRGPASKFGRYLLGGSFISTGNAAFDRKFRIQAKNRDEASALFGPTLIAEHLAGRLPMWSLRDGMLLSYTHGQFRKPAEVPGAVAPLVRVADLLGR